MNSRTVDLIYLDPPFNSNKQYAALDGTAAEGQMFDDVWKWTDLDDRWLSEIDNRNEALSAVIRAARLAQNEGTAAYLTMMGVRLLELHRVLKPTGSIYLHCDDTANSYLRLCLDAVFGHTEFRNEITWQRSSAGKGSQYGDRSWGRNVDHIFFYGGSYLRPYKKRTSSSLDKKFNRIAENGERYYDNSGNLYRGRKQGARPNLCYKWSPPDHPNLTFENRGPEGWQLSKPRLDEEYAKGNIVVDSNGKLRRRKYARDDEGEKVNSHWDDIPPEFNGTGWDTEKPLALLRRIIKASSNPGDVVLDPFAGCATCCVAAEMEGRQWVGIEACEEATKITRRRLNEAELGSLGRSKPRVIVKRSAPRRTDADAPPPEKPKPKRTTSYKTIENMQKLYGRQFGYCNGCGVHYRDKDFHHDHIHPRSKDGGDEIANLQLLCGHCNSTKGNRDMERLWERLYEQQLPISPAGWKYLRQRGCKDWRIA